jgi:hypothetical protein
LRLAQANPPPRRRHGAVDREIAGDPVLVGESRTRLKTNRGDDARGRLDGDGIHRAPAAREQVNDDVGLGPVVER